VLDPALAMETMEGADRLRGTAMIRRRPVLLAVAFALAATAVTVPAVDRVIFRDGYVLEGTVFKEQERINDAQNGFSLSIPKAKGFDVLDDGLRWWIFSKHQKQAAEIQQNIKGLETIKEYEKTVIPRQLQSLPAFGQFTAPDFDKNWKRTIRVKTGGGNFQDIEQFIRVLGPKRMIHVSTTHKWYPYFSTREFSPATLRSLLVTHPELDEKGKPDPTKRIAIASFFLQGEFLDAAKAELDRARKDIPGAWTKDQDEAFDKMKTSIAKAEAKLVVDELEVAKLAGRYAGGQEIAKLFDPKNATAELANRYSKLKAELDLVRPNFDKAHQYLRAALDDLALVQLGPPAAAGGPAGLLAARRQIPERTLKLLDAGEQVLLELHPDNVERIDIFRKLADDVARLKRDGKSGGTRPESLLALAVSGWVLGPNGADNNTENALRLWNWRETLLAYQNEAILNNRRALISAAQKTGKPMTAEILSQIIQYLPPPKPAEPFGADTTPVPTGGRLAAGIVKRATGPLKEDAGGVDYLVRLPSEYHHGRPYPVVLALAHPSLPAEELVTLLSYEADRNGFILAAPLWTDGFDRGYDWSGEQHHKVTATVRSLLRHYRVDPDRVLMFGFGNGANLALDVGSSHPDLFAGVVAMASNPKYIGHFMHYWRNCQKLPVYFASGALGGAGLENVRSLFEQWMPKGFPAIASVYRGRGSEWFSGDIHLMFEWMRLKKRVTGTGVLRLNQFAVEPWTIMRKEDNRFYWVGTEEVAPNNLIKTKKVNGFVPAEIKADIFQGNEIKISSRGLKNVTIWLDREMIDWTKPISVRINTDVPRGWKPKVLTPDLDLMLEQFYEHGDRSLLFLNKLSFDVTP
jgi:pimeloyl-ACP methyl ester carboxylesterase